MLSEKLNVLADQYKDGNFFQKKFVLSEMKGIHKELVKASSEIESERKEFSRTYSKVIKQLEKGNNLTNSLKASLMGDKQHSNKGMDDVMSALNPYIAGTIKGISNLVFDKVGKKDSSEAIQRNIDKIRPRTRGESSGDGFGGNDEALKWQKQYYFRTEQLFVEMKNSLVKQETTLVELHKAFVDLTKDMESEKDSTSGFRNNVGQAFNQTFEYLEKQITELTNINHNLQQLKEKPQSTSPKIIKAKNVELNSEASELTNEFLNEILTYSIKASDSLMKIDSNSELIVEYLDGMWTDMNNIKPDHGDNDSTGLMRVLDGQSTILERIAENTDQLILQNAETQSIFQRMEAGQEKDRLAALEARSEQQKQSSIIPSKTEEVSPEKDSKGGGWLSGVIGAIMGIALKDVIKNSVKGILTKSFEFGKSIIGGLIDGVKAIGSKVFGGVMEAFSGISKFFGEVFGVLGKGGKVLEFFKSARAIPVVGEVLTILSSVWDFFSGIKDAGKILDKEENKLTIRDYISAGIGSVIGGFVGIIDAVAGLFGIDTGLEEKTKKSVAKWLSGGSSAESASLATTAKTQQQSISNLDNAIEGAKAKQQTSTGNTTINAPTTNSSTHVSTGRLTTRNADDNRWQSRLGYNAGGVL